MLAAISKTRLRPSSTNFSVAYSPFVRYHVLLMSAFSLRCELISRAEQYARSQGLPFQQSYGEMPVVCFPPRDGRNGNFIPASYKAIISNPAWKGRLNKVHPLGRTSLPPNENGRWMELDSCTSSDALLMNIFCYPGVLRRKQTLELLGIEAATEPCFGCRARVPLIDGKVDRTEVDLRLGNLLIEAKLTESDFQRVGKRVLTTYRDFRDVFVVEQLPQTKTHFLSYQLLRNVLAAYALQCCFCVVLDDRRKSLLEAWYAVMRCVKPIELKTALRVLTWQELAKTLPLTLRRFLALKYGIV
jgi:hypothetical protein